MVNEIQYTNIKRVLDNLIDDHPLLRDLTLEQAVRYTLRFIGLHGYPNLYIDKIEDVDIKDFRGLLPCDLIRITQVKDLDSGICLRAMTDNFTPGLLPEGALPAKRKTGITFGDKQGYIPPESLHHGELAYKVQNRVIFTSFPNGKVGISYKAIPVDEDGFPLLISDETYLNALENFILVKVYTNKFEAGKIAGGILQNAKQEYAWSAGQLHSAMMIPNTSEMEAIVRSIHTLIPRMREFDNGFKDLGNREYLVKH